ALIALPGIVNPWIRVRSDTWLHGAIALEILDRGIPPHDPRFAGLTLNYVWIFNFFIAQLVSLAGGNPFTFMVVFNVVNTAVFLCLVWHIAFTVWRGAAAAGMLFVHGVVGLSVLPVAAATLALTAVLARRHAWLPGLSHLLAFGAAIVVGVALAAPYTWAISRAWAEAKTGVRNS